MKCQRTFQLEITDEGKYVLAGAECIKWECSIWDEHFQKCSEALPTFMQTLRVEDHGDKVIYFLKEE